MMAANTDGEALDISNVKQVDVAIVGAGTAGLTRARGSRPDR